MTIAELIDSLGAYPPDMKLVKNIEITPCWWVTIDGLVRGIVYSEAAAQAQIESLKERGLIAIHEQRLTLQER